jgi:hypothetical protein
MLIGDTGENRKLDSGVTSSPEIGYCDASHSSPPAPGAFILAPVD